jgi:hypothetical protein
LQGQAIIGGAQAPTGALALVLEANRPIRALEALTIGFDTDRPEEVEFLFGAIGFTIDYAVMCFHRVPRYASPYQGSSDYIYNNSRILCQAVPSYARLYKDIEK